MVSMVEFKGRSLVSINDLTKEEVDYVLDFAMEIKKDPLRFANQMKGMIMAPLFFEDSTRTSSSFQASILKMGGSVLDFDSDRSSVKKGETLRDTLKTIGGYNPDFVIIRHSKDGSAKFASDILDMPVINAGDGQNQHPTQTLLDLFTIKEILGGIDSCRIILAGDLKYGRTVHSLALALARFSNCRLYFISPDNLRMPQEILRELGNSRCGFSEHNLDELQGILEKINIVYMTRIQRERFPEGPEGDQMYESVSKNYCLKLDMLEGVDPRFKIMHPLPKVREIEEAIDDTKYAYYFQQARNGLFIRMALLVLIGGKNE